MLRCPSTHRSRTSAGLPPALHISALLIPPGPRWWLCTGVRTSCLHAAGPLHFVCHRTSEGGCARGSSVFLGVQTSCLYAVGPPGPTETMSFSYCLSFLSIRVFRTPTMSLPSPLELMLQLRASSSALLGAPSALCASQCGVQLTIAPMITKLRLWICTMPMELCCTSLQHGWPSTLRFRSWKLFTNAISQHLGSPTGPPR